MPKNQLYVLRVSPKWTIEEVLVAVCKNRGFDQHKFDIRHPGKTLCGHMAAWVVSTFWNTYHLKYNTSKTTLMYPYVNNTSKT